MINASKRISEPFIATTEPTSKNWYIGFWYYDPTGKRKLYKFTTGLNKTPFVTKGIVNVDIKVVAQRLVLATNLVKALRDRLETTNFNTNTGTFALSPLDLSFASYMANFICDSQKAIEASLSIYQNKVNVITKYIKETSHIDLPLKEITKDWVNTFLEHVRITTSLQNRDAYMVFLKSVFIYLVENQELQINNPIKKFNKLYKGQTDKHRAINASDINQSFQTIASYDYPLSLMAKLIFYSLHRITTICQIKFSDLNLSTGQIYLPSRITKNNQRQTIHLPKILVEEIQSLIHRLDRKPQPDDYLLGYDISTVNSKGRPKFQVQIFGRNQTPSSRFKNTFGTFKRKMIKQQHEIFTKYHTLYGYKHSGIKYLLDCGYTPKQIITVTGHKNESILETYSKDHIPELVKFPDLP